MRSFSIHFFRVLLVACAANSFEIILPNFTTRCDGKIPSSTFLLLLALTRTFFFFYNFHHTSPCLPPTCVHQGLSHSLRRGFPFYAGSLFDLAADRNTQSINFLPNTLVNHFLSSSSLCCVFRLLLSFALALAHRSGYLTTTMDIQPDD